MKGLIGKKVGMTQLYDDKGVLTPVTVVQAGPCVVIDVKNVERDGYSAVLFGFGSRKAKNAGKAVAGQAAKAGVNTPSIMKEFRITDDSKFEIGAEIGAGIFDIGCRESPGNIIKGKKMPGQHGSVKRTVQNLRVVKVDSAENLIFVSGAIPGPNGGTVLVRKAIKK